MDTANETRGEFAITLGGLVHAMRPTYEATVAFEAATGKAVVELARAAAAGALTVEEAAEIVTHCVRAWGEAAEPDAPIEQVHAAGVNANRIGKLLADHGMLYVNHLLKLMLHKVVTGGVDVLGKAKPMATMGHSTSAHTGAGSQA